MGARDASVIYGSTKEAQQRVRTFEDGKLKIRSDGWLVTDTAKDLPISGDIRNQWAGVSAMQSLFIAEHNMVCDVIKVSGQLACQFRAGVWNYRNLYHQLCAKNMRIDIFLYLFV